MQFLLLIFCCFFFAAPVSARCGDGLIQDPGGGNFCVPKDSSDSDAVFAVCSARVENYRRISIANGWREDYDPVDEMKSCMENRGQRF